MRPTPTLAPEWERPERVELASPATTLASARTILETPLSADFSSLETKLKIWNRRRGPIADLRPSHVVRARPDLLERFFGLADAPDAKLQRFAELYGGLEIFYRLGDARNVHIEYCDVWRYFAAGMQALLRIGSALYAAKRPAVEDWGEVGNYPKLMDEIGDESAQIDPLRYPISIQEAWLTMARYIRMRRQPYQDEARDMFIRLVNTLVAFGNVRPWIVWPSGKNRPQLLYASRSLVSALTLQFWLRVAKADAFVLCTHCQTQYFPGERAPKTGQRHFCPKCRKNGIPGQYALRDFRQRQK